MSKKGIARHIVLGLAIAGMVSASVVIHVLRDAYQVELAEGGLPDKYRTIEVNYRGTKTTIEVPTDTHLSGPDARKELEAITREQIENDPKLKEAKAMRLTEWKAQAVEERMKRLNERERQQLKIATECGLDDNTREKLITQVKQSTLASREKCKQLVDSFGK